MKFTFTAALFAIAADAAAPGASDVSQSFQIPPPKALKGFLRGNQGNLDFARRLAPYGFPYYSDGCLPDNYKDKCSNCMCLDGGEGNPVQRKQCDLGANPDGNDHCVDKFLDGEECTDAWQCYSNRCNFPGKGAGRCGDY